MLFRWRVQLGYGKEKVKLATVKLADGPTASNASSGMTATILHDLLPTPDGMAAFELPGGQRIFAPAGADPEAVRRYVVERETAS